MKMTKYIFLAVLSVLLMASASYAQRSIGVLAEEADGSPAGFAVKLILPNDSLAITGGVATLTIAGAGTVTGVGDSTNTAPFTVAGGGNTLYFQGTSIDGIETILTAANATGSDKTITLPAETGTVLLSDGTNTDNAVLRSDGTGSLAQTSGVVIDDSNNVSGVGTLATTGLATFNAGIAVKYADTAAGFIQIFEDSDDGTNKITIQAVAIASDYTLTLPTTDGDANQVLTTNGSGVLSWTTPSAGSGDVTAAAAIDSTAVVVGDDGAKGVKKTGVLIDGSNNISGGASLALGTDPADAGTIRLPNAGSILFESAPASTDVNALQVTSGEVVQIGASGAASVTITPATTFSGGITDAGTIAAGTWNGTAIAAAYIGTDLTPANLGATQTYSDGDLIDFSAITHSSTTPEGLKLPTWGNFNPSAGVGYIAWDTASSSIKIYDAGWKAFAAAAAPIDSRYIIIAGDDDTTLTGERELVAGTGLTLTDAGANGNATLDFDPTEITGARTWAAGGAASVAWTWDNSGTLDPSLTFGDGLITSNSSVTIATGKNLTIGTTQLNLSDTIDASKITITSQAQGDVLYASSGTAWARLGKDATATRYLSNTGTSNNPAWAQVNLSNGVTSTLPVGNGGTGLTSGTSGGVPYYSASDAMTSSAALAQYQIVMGGGAGAAPATLGSAGTAGQLLMSGGASANPSFAGTLTGSYVFGDADTDTVTIRSRIIGGNSRQVNIDDDDTSAPTYATATNELYVEGDIESGGNIYATSFVGGTGTDGQRGITLTSNTALTPTADQIYFINDVLYFSQAGSQKTPMRLEDTQTATGIKTFTGGIYLGDASSATTLRLYDGSSNYWTIAVPSMSSNYTLTLPTDDGTANQVLQTDGSGTLSWGTVSATAAGSAGSVQYTSTGSGGALEGSAHFTYVVGATYADVVVGSEGTGRIGRLGLAYEGGSSDYTGTLMPNSGMSGDVTITLPSYTTTLLGSGTNTFTAYQAITGVNVAGAGQDTLTLSGTLGIFDGSDVFRGVYLNYTNANHTGTGNSVALIDTAAITGDANSNLYAIRIGALTGTTGAAGEVEYAISIGSGWDRGVSSASVLYVGDGTNGATISATGAQTFAGTATFSAAGATTSIPWVTGSGTASNTTEGTAYWETDTDMLTIGDGATGISLDFTANTVITFPSATGTLLTTTGTPAAMVIASQATGDLLYASSSTAWSRLGIQAAGYVLGGGATPAWTNAPQITTIELGAATDTTLSRLSAGVIQVEGVTIATVGANTFTGNQLLDDGTGASPTLTFQDGTDETVAFSKVDAGYLTITTVAGDGVNILVGNLKVGDGSPGQTIDGEDLYVNGLVEIDGVLYADGGITLQNAETITNADDTEIAFNGTESIALDLDAGTNVVGWKNKTTGSTGVTGMDFAALNLTTTGTISGAVNAPEVFIDCAGAADPYAYCTSANAATLTATQVNRTIINSYGRGEAQTDTLPTAAAGMTFIAVVGTQHDSAWKIQRGGTDTINWNGTAGKTYFQETNQAVGSRVSCFTFKTGAAAWTWMCGSSSGTWATD